LRSISKTSTVGCATHLLRLSTVILSSPKYHNERDQVFKVLKRGNCYRWHLSDNHTVHDIPYHRPSLFCLSLWLTFQSDQRLYVRCSYNILLISQKCCPHTYFKCVSLDLAHLQLPVIYIFFIRNSKHAISSIMQLLLLVVVHLSSSPWKYVDCCWVTSYCDYGWV